MKNIKRKAINKITKKKRKEYIKEVKNQGRCKTITLKCKKCKTIYRINTTTPDIYTKEVIKKWKCLFCKKEVLR